MSPPLLSLPDAAEDGAMNVDHDDGTGTVHGRPTGSPRNSSTHISPPETRSDEPMDTVVNIQSLGDSLHAAISGMDDAARADVDAHVPSNFTLIDGRQMVDVGIFNRTMHFLGKKAFLDGYEEGRTVALEANPTRTASRAPVIPGSSSSRPRTSSSGTKEASASHGGEDDDDDDDDDDDESDTCLKGRKSRKSTGKRSPNEVFLMVSNFENVGRRGFFSFYTARHKVVSEESRSQPRERRLVSSQHPER